MSSSDYTNDELESFLSRADEVHAAVKGLADGSVSADDTDRLLARMDRAPAQAADPAVEAYRREKREKEALEQQHKGVRGQGARPGYLYFCRRCFREYDLEPLPELNGACCHCQSKLVTRQERMEELQTKVAVMATHKQERAKRRQQFAQWKSARKAANEEPKMVVLGPNGKSESDERRASDREHSLHSSYQDWDLWEPSSDDDVEVPQPDHPEFAAMKADIEAREEKKKAEKIVSERENEAGNAMVKQKNYLQAIEHYSRAIDHTRGEKSYYTNRALCYIHTYDFTRALKDCSNALNIYECFEEDHVRYRSDYKNMKIVLKGFLRRARAEIGLEQYSSAKESLTRAVEIIKEVYATANRQDTTHENMKKAELKEIEKMRREIEEKERFKEEERKLKEVDATKEKTQSDGVDSGSSSGVPSSASPSDGADSGVLTTLLDSLRESYTQLLNIASGAPTPATATATATSKSITWSSLDVAFAFYALTLDSDGNKERVAGQIESRKGIEAILKLLKAYQLNRKKSSSPSSSPSSPSSSTPASTFLPPDFVRPTLQFAPSHASHASNLIQWREADGFAIIGRYIMQLVTMLTAGADPASSSPPPATLSGAVRILTLLADREHGREYLVSPAHVAAIIDTTIDILTPSSSSPSSSSYDVVTQRHASNLLGNLSFQPTLRSWLIAPPTTTTTTTTTQVGMLERIYTTLVQASLHAATLKGEGGLLSSLLAGIINLFTSQACRTRFIQLSSNEAPPVKATNTNATNPPTTPLSQLLSLLATLSASWSKHSYKLSSSDTDVAEKLLGILLNLTVDDIANRLVFETMSPTTLVNLFRLASQPGSNSDPSLKASLNSLRSILSPILVERALGVVTRGIRREHNAAKTPTAGSQAATTTPAPAGGNVRPIRRILMENDAIVALMRILMHAPFAMEEESVSTENVLAKLKSTVDSKEDSNSSNNSSSSSSSSSSSFRYTRVTLDHASVCMAVCMAQDTNATKIAADITFQGCNGLTSLVGLLDSPSKNLVGNACLCIDAMAAIPELVTRPELSPALDKLLSVLKDPSQSSAHQNAAKAAILIGRAPTNVAKWQQLKGIQIIATVLNMK